MDLMNFVPTTDNVVVELKIKDKNLTNPDGSNMTITVMSPFSKEHKKILEAIREKRFAKKDQVDKVDYEQLLVDTLVDTTVDWNITWDGKQPNFDKELAREIYNKAFWIKLQIQEGQASVADFSIP